MIAHAMQLAVWFSSSALVSTNEVTPRRARVSSGIMVTVFGRENHLHNPYVTTGNGLRSVRIYSST